MKKLEFIVYGEPKGKGRPRFKRMGNFVTTYTDKDTEIYENKVLMAYKEQLKNNYGTFYDNQLMFPKGTLVELEITCVFPLSKADYGKKGLNKSGRTKLDKYFCDKKPDIDNIIKSIQDGLNGVAYSDDSQVVKISAMKIYSETPPRVEIIIREL